MKTIIAITFGMGLAFAQTPAATPDTPTTVLPPVKLVQAQRDYLAAQMILQDAQNALRILEQKMLVQCVKTGQVLDPVSATCVAPPPPTPTPAAQ